MIHNGKKYATTGLKEPHRQRRESGQHIEIVNDDEWNEGGGGGWRLEKRGFS